MHIYVASKSLNVWKYYYIIYFIPASHFITNQAASCAHSVSATELRFGWLSIYLNFNASQTCVVEFEIFIYMLIYFEFKSARSCISLLHSQLVSQPNS